MIDPDKPEELAEAERAQRPHGRSARSRMDGTCTGEHGVGYGKMEFLDRRARRGGERDAHDQEGARSRQHHEPGQDRPRLGLQHLADPSP